MEVYAVELQNVTKQFGDVTAVHDVSLQISDGEFYTMLGPSGCGKTTTLRMIAGFEMPSEGEVYIEGELMGLTPPFQRNTNMVFQNYALFPHMTVHENVAFGLEMKGLAKEGIQDAVDEALEMIRLRGYGERSSKQLSGGEQQRVALARALVNKPGVLLLDEPLGALDLKLRKAMQLELKELQERLGITFIYVTHDQEEALTMSDRIAVMDRGAVLQVGPPPEIYENPATRFVADFIGESNFLSGTITGLTRDVATLQVNGLENIAASAHEEFSVGQRATLTVRPEKIDIGAVAPTGSTNVLRGNVEDVVYIGTDTNYLVRVTEEHLLRVRKQNESSPLAEEAFQEGTSVYLNWLPESARLLPE